MLNYLWIAFFVISFIVALIKLVFFGDTEVFKMMVDGTFSSAKVAVMDIALPLVGIMTLWLGIMNIGEKAGAIRVLARVIGPFFEKIFPEVPRNHPAVGHMVMNFSANMLGLDNAATPFGLKAMESLQELNPQKETASNAQIMFLVINTAGFTLLPIGIIAQRSILGAADPSDVFIPCILASVVATLVGLIAVALRQKISLFNKVVFSWLGSILLFIAVIVYMFAFVLTREQIGLVSKIGSNIILLTIIVGFIAGGLYKKINVYDAFIEGAKQGFKTCTTIIPYLVGMLVAISVLRNSGVMGYITDSIAWLVTRAGVNADFTHALPTALMKPLSGSGARAMMIESMKTYGPDSFVGRLSCVFNGAADTTFYIVALYFGAVNIKHTRYSIGYGLIADLAGALAAILIAYVMFH